MFQKWLVHILNIVTEDSYFDNYVDELLKAEGLSEWWSRYKELERNREIEARRQAALAKLTREERIILGLEKPFPGGVLTAQAGFTGGIWLP